MTLNVQEWLPETALTDPVSLGQIDAAIAQWSDTWFGGRKMQRCGSVATHPPSSNGNVRANPAWRCFAQGIYFAWDSVAQLALAKHALAAEGQRPKLSPPDSVLLERYADQIGRELTSTVRQSLALPDRAPPSKLEAPGRGLQIDIGTANGTCRLSLIIEYGLLVQARKRSCPNWAPQQVRLKKIPEVLGHTQIAFEAVLGSADLSAWDVRNLAPGDVIILKRKTNEDLPLRATATAPPVSKARLTPHNNEYLLKAS